MAMQTVTQGNAAYDLSLFEEKPRQNMTVVKPTKQAVRSQNRRTRLQTLINVATTLLVLVTVCAVVGLVIFNNVQITEINNEILQKQEELDILNSENIRLSNELASQISAEQVDEYAESHGMQKIDSYQLQYITVGGGDKLEVAESGETGFFESIGAGISAFFHWVAYLFE